MRDAVKFSIVIPVYNVAEYVGECLDSVLKQTHAEWEAICVDDGSTDGSGTIVDEYAKKNSRIRVLHQRNAGVSVARNAALDVATGDYVCFVDSDDGIVPEYLNILTDLIGRTGADIISFGHINVKSADQEVGKVGNYTLRHLDLTREADAVTGFRTFVGSGLAWNACYRKNTLGDLRFLPIPNGEDVLFASMAFLRAQSLCLSNAHLYKYAYRPGSAVNTMSAQHLLSKCEMCEALKVAVDGWRWRASVTRQLASRFRTHFVGEIASNVKYVDMTERKMVWNRFFAALRVCSWGRWVEWVAKSESSFGVALMVLEYNLRRFAADIRRRTR